MNQILQVDEKKKSSSVDTKKVVLFFAVAIFIFGLIFVGQGAYTLYQNKANEKVTSSTPEGSGSVQEPEYVAPIITLTKTEDNKLVINVQSEITISHIIYNWNSEAAQTLDETGKTNIEEIIDIPTGENTINISVIDSSGIETKKQATYVIEVSKPIIELSVVGNNIKIAVTSEEELSYVTYKWNLDEEKKEDMETYEDKTRYEKEVEIPVGQNTLKIVAVDTNGNITEKTQEIKGVAKLRDPEVVARDGYLHFTFEAEENMKTVEITFNGENYLMDTSTFGETKIVHYKFKMVEGWNYLKLVGTTENGAQNTTVWKREYKAQ